MNKALNALKEANPNLYAEFIELLSEDLGLGGDTSVSPIRCPNCQAQIQVALSQSTAAQPARGGRRGRPARKTGRTRRQWNPKPNSLFNLLVRVAKIRRTTTGGVSAEFNKSMRSKLKGLSPAEAREVKIQWLNDQISKAGKSKGQAA